MIRTACELIVMFISKSTQRSKTPQIIKTFELISPPQAYFVLFLDYGSLISIAESKDFVVFIARNLIFSGLRPAKPNLT